MQAALSASPESQNKYEVMSIFLTRNPHKQRIFHCFLCRWRVFKFQGEFASAIPGDATAEQAEQETQGEVMKAPFSIKCQGKSMTQGRCPMLYVIDGFVQ